MLPWILILIDDNSPNSTVDSILQIREESALFTTSDSEDFDDSEWRATSSQESILDFLQKVCDSSRQIARFSPWIHLAGPSCCGKTTIIRRFLENIKFSSIYIDCREVAHSEQRIFTYILNRLKLVNNLRSKRKSRKNDQDTNDYAIVKHIVDFLNQFQALELTFDRLLIVFDNADKLKSFKTCQVLQILANMSDFDDRSTIQIVTICKIPFWHLISKDFSLDYDPIQICLPKLTQGYDKNFGKFCQKSTEIRQKTDQLKFNCLDFAVRALYHDLNLTELKSLIENQLLTLLDAYQQKSIDVSNRKDQTQAFKEFKTLISYRSKIEPSDQNLQTLSNRIKILIIAAFLASYNQPSADARFFLKKCDKKRVSKKPGNDLRNRLLKGPSIFTFERLLFIYVKLCDLHFEDPSPLIDDYNEILTEISSLCSSKLLCRTSNEKIFSSIKLKCLCPYGKVKDICSSINFDLDQYLFSR